MPVLSNKAQKMPESPIRKLVPYSEAAKRIGKKVYHLNIGQPDIKTPEPALRAVKEADLEVLEYSHSAGNESYRNKLVSYYDKRNLVLNKDELIVTTGGSEAILFALGSIANPGDEVLIPEPFYANYGSFCIASGVDVKPVISTIREGFALPPIGSFEELITPKTKAIMICNPGNPTGYLYSKEELKMLATLVKKHDLFLVADEVYREFVYDGHYHNSIMEMPDLKENAIVIDSISKRFSMCGARIGCLISRNKAVMHAALKFAQARLSPPTYAQIAAEAALSVDDSYYQEVNEEYVKRRDILVEGLNKIPNVFCPKPKGAFYCMAELPVQDSEDFAKFLLEDFDVDNETLMVAPAQGFYATPGLGRNQIRLAYVLNENALKKSLLILEKGLEAYARIEMNRIQNI